MAATDGARSSAWRSFLARLSGRFACSPLVGGLTSTGLYSGSSLAESRVARLVCTIQAVENEQIE